MFMNKCYNIITKEGVMSHQTMYIYRERDI